MSPHQLLLPEEAVYFTCVVLSKTPSDDSLAFTMQLTMLFVDELQFEAAFHESYNESGTMISLLDGVFWNAFTWVSDGTDAAFLKSNIVQLEQLVNVAEFMVVTLADMEILVSPVQTLNAPFPKLVTLSGIVMFVRPEQPMNAAVPILVTEGGIVNSVNP